LGLVKERPEKNLEDRCVARQLTLDLTPAPRFAKEDFLVSASNAAAFRMIEAWPDWPDKVLLLVGPAGSGKSHLGAIWAQKAGARILDASHLQMADLPDLVQAGAVLVEDADRLGAVETQLFHLLNLARERQAFVILTARALPLDWQLATADLLSRLRLAPLVEIGEPDEALLRAVLVKLFDDRQLLLDHTVLEYVALRLDRSFEAARGFVETADRMALSLGRPVTRTVANEVLRLQQEQEGFDEPG
jgi:chromosomal replication initiation ATPase DnaA